MHEKNVVVFTTNNARIIPNPPTNDLLKLAEFKNAVVDPDLSLVQGVAPHFWKLKDGQIVPMNDIERISRLKHIEKYGIDNAVQEVSIAKTQMRHFFLKYDVEVYIGWFINFALLVYVILILKGKA